MTQTKEYPTPINASEIERVLTHGSITFPKVDQYKSDATVQTFDLDGYVFKALTFVDHHNEVQLVFDLKTGIAYELMPTKPGYEEVDSNDYGMSDSLPSHVS